MRIVTRPDFDGVICAALLYEAEKITEPVKWVRPNDVQRGLVEIRSGDIIANLPYDQRCSLWFDHHYSNQIDRSFEGAFKLAPSAANVVFDYYKDRFQHDYTELIEATDKIDSADLAVDEVLYPEKNLYLLLSMTIYGNDFTDERYWNRLVELFREQSIQDIVHDREIKKRCEEVIKQNEQYGVYLKKYTKLVEPVCVTDFRSLDQNPRGNRFLVYALFPQTIASVKIRYDDEARQIVAVSVGHNIFNRNCNVNVGSMLAKYEGGGHPGAGSCRFHFSKADNYIPEIIDILTKNEINER